MVIAKRLAQCLHPALPSGVHLKALETYDLIFKLIGPGKLASELFIFSAGYFKSHVLKVKLKLLFHFIARSLSFTSTCCN